MRRSFRLHLLLPALCLSLAACGGGGGTDDGDGGGDDHAHTASGATCPTGSTLTYENFGAPFMQSYCSSCHSTTSTGPQRGGAPLNHNYDTRAGILQWRADIDTHAAAGPTAVNTLMPPSLPKPSQADREKLGQWLACGAP